jgi:hypothetical protein
MVPRSKSQTSVHLPPSNLLEARVWLGLRKEGKQQVVFARLGISRSLLMVSFGNLITRSHIHIHFPSTDPEVRPLVSPPRRRRTTNARFLTMKSLRRSLNSDKSNHNNSQQHSVTGPLPTPLSAPIMGGYGDSSLSRPSVKVAPPQKVIKATHSYQSTVPQILSYQKGDFYYVTDEYPGDAVHPEGWYAALSELLLRG